MAIISQETWDKMPEEEKEKIINSYKTIKDDNEFFKETEHPLNAENIITSYETLFGKENLQPKPKIRTWEDIEKLLPEDGFCVDKFEKFADNPKITLKCRATLKIAKLIELGYGGMVTEEEWKDHTTDKYSIGWDEEDNCPLLKYHCSRNYVDFISFHTKQQAEEFMSYSENVELVKQYNMIL